MYTHKAIMVEAEENQSNLLKIKRDTYKGAFALHKGREGS